MSPDYFRTIGTDILYGRDFGPGDVQGSCATACETSIVRRMFAGQSIVPVVGGMAAGIVGAAALGRVVEHLMTTARGAGLWTCALAATVLAVTALAAIWTATQAVLRLQPLDVLRAE